MALGDKYDGGWTLLSGANPSMMVACDNKLMVYFPGAGFYLYDGSTRLCLLFLVC